MALLALSSTPSIIGLLFAPLSKINPRYLNFATHSNENVSNYTIDFGLNLSSATPATNNLVLSALIVNYFKQQNSLKCKKILRNLSIEVAIKTTSSANNNIKIYVDNSDISPLVQPRPNAINLSLTNK